MRSQAVRDHGNMRSRPSHPIERIAMLKKLRFVVCALALPVVALPAFAQDGPSCSVAAAEKKLAGAAKNSFMKKCEKDATDRCEAAAAEKKLAGAAKNSFTKKCVKDAVGE